MHSFSSGGVQHCQPIVCRLIHLSMPRCLSIPSCLFTSQTQGSSPSGTILQAVHADSHKTETRVTTTDPSPLNPLRSNTPEWQQATMANLDRLARCPQLHSDRLPSLKSTVARSANISSCSRAESQIKTGRRKLESRWRSPGRGKRPTPAARSKRRGWMAHAAA